MTSLRILVVEDHPASNEILRDLLLKRGHSVECALTARRATEAVQETPFDLALIDLKLPDGDGWALYAALKVLRPVLRAIALSGCGFDTDLVKSAAAGFAVHLTKPIAVVDLDRAILHAWAVQP